MPESLVVIPVQSICRDSTPGEERAMRGETMRIISTLSR